MCEWDEAARRAGIDIAKNYGYDGFAGDEMVEYCSSAIAKHFADLRATYERLIRLVELKNQRLILASAYMTPLTWAEMNSSTQGFDLNCEIVAIESDPLVKKAIEMHKDKERGA